MRPPPPAPAARLLRWLLPAGDRERVAAEMDELYERRVRLHGAGEARRWYRRQVVSFARRVALERLAGRSGRPGRGHAQRGGTMGGAGAGLVDAVRQDAAFAWRQLVGRPGSTLVALAVLVLGVGSGTVVFSVVDGVVLRPLPFEAAERLGVVGSVQLESGGPHDVVAPPPYLLWSRAADQAVEGVAAFSGSGGLDLEGAGEPEHLASTSVDRRFFSLLGVEPALGRGFLPDENAPGGPGAVVLSHGLWTRSFGSDPEVVGGAVRLGGELRTIVGVMPPAFDFPQGTDVWVPLGPELEGMEGVWGALFLQVVTRLRPDATPEAAAAELTALNAADPEGMAWGARVTPLREHLTGDVERVLLLLLGAVVLVLLVTCANVGGLLLSRTAGRRRELAVRAALGAGRGRLVSVVLIEGLMLALIAGTLGIAAAHLGLDGVLALAPADLPRSSAIAVDGRVLAFAVGATVVTGLVAGLVPALRLSDDVLADLRAGETSADAAGPGGHVRSALVVGQVAASVMLLAGAALLGRSFLTLVGQDVGFEPDGLVTVNLSLPEHRYAEPLDLLSFYESLERRVRALPGVEAVAFSQNLPLGGRNMAAPVVREGRDEPGPSSPVERASVGYFETLGIAVRRGRGFRPEDREAPAPVVVVSEAFARIHFAGEDALGGRIRTYFDREYAEIVGVVEDVRHDRLAAAPPPVVYQLLERDPARGVHLAVRAQVPPARLFPAIREAIRTTHPGQTVREMAAMGDLLVRDAARPRFWASLLGAFAAVALLLSMLGLHGLLASRVLQRRREIGIRMALGADAARVRRLVIAHGLALTAAGVALGIGGALATGRLLEGLLYEVRPTSVPVLAAVAALLLATAAASVHPIVRRASQVDPIEVLGA